MSETPNEQESRPTPTEGEGEVRPQEASAPGAVVTEPKPESDAASESEPPATTNPSSPPIPLVARRVIKLNESSRPPARPTPVIESEEAYLEDLSEHLTEEEIRNLSPVPSSGADQPRIPADARLPSGTSLSVDEPVVAARSGMSEEGVYTSASSSYPPGGPPRPKTSLPPAGRAGPRTPTPPRRNKAPTPPPPKRTSDPSLKAATPQPQTVTPVSSRAAGPIPSGDSAPTTSLVSAAPPAPSRAARPAAEAPGAPPNVGALSGAGAPPAAPSKKMAMPPADKADLESDKIPPAPALSDDFDDTTPIPISVDPPPVEAPPPHEPDLLERSPDSFEEVDTVEEFSDESAAPEPEIPPADRKPPPPRRSAAPSLPKVQKPRKKPWWETLFGDDFSRAYRPMTSTQLSREVDFVQKALDVPSGSVILDLGCGQGEICVELARRGFSMVGYDLSVFQLAMAGDNAQSAHQKINFLQGDMREMAFEQMFDAVVCWDTSFGYFEEDKNIDVLRRIKAALKPGGRLLLDILNRDFVAREAPYNHWFEGDGCVCMDDMSMDWITNRLRVKRSIILDDGRSKELLYSVRLYGLSDVGRMLHDVGFRVSAVSGDVCTPGAFFGPSSRRIIITANKP